MLSRSLLVSSAPPARTGAATPLLQHGRLLVVPRARPPSRSSSPRNGSWRTNWRAELDSETSSNSNGIHTHVDADYRTLYDSRTAAATIEEEFPSYPDRHQQQYQHDQPEDGESYYWDSEGALRPDQGSNTQAADNGGGAEDMTSETATDGTGLFTDAFKEALKAALERSPLYGNAFGGEGSGGEEDEEPQPYENELGAIDRPIFTDQFRAALKESLERQQAEADLASGYGSDDDYTPVPYVPQAPARREMSPLEEVIATALGASQLHLRRLNLMKNEIEAAIERETKQVERLAFALKKAESDVAYYKTLERMNEERKH
ncbi:hypothetical protein Agub_g2001 [Astrephomene gubernaculifera]|uniref:Uncharacterized protein n=1 Tax=Astrephomene gubernaculifera TaxID=47775 RepID=A0AAD3DIH9_9CHLO|nr:hypothetical protein Agub_g2001 [Astrephomene gubernaculifera]